MRERRERIDSRLAALKGMLPAAIYTDIRNKLGDWHEGIEPMLQVANADRLRSFGGVFFSSFNRLFDGARRDMFRRSFFSMQPADQVTEWAHAIAEIDVLIKDRYPSASQTFDELVALLHETSATMVTAD